MGVTLDLIHANELLEEIGYVQEIDQYDGEISQESDSDIFNNSFALTVSDEVWQASPILRGHYVYVVGNEFGGLVEQIEHSTSRAQVTVSGVTWRGMLYRKIIIPPVDDAYLRIMAMEANDAVDTIIDGSLGSLFTVSTENSGVTVSRDFRYTNMLIGIGMMLSEKGAALNIEYSQATKTVNLSVRKVIDYSDEIDLSQDYGVDIVTTYGGFDRYNHIVALGAGELLERDILHIYRKDDGTITTVAPAWVGTAEDLMTTFDFSNPETIEMLQDYAEKRAKEFTPLNQVEIDPAVDGLEFKLGDIVGARDRLTGMVGTAVIVGRILTMNQLGIKLETRVR